MSGFPDLPSDARPPWRGPTLLGRLLRDLVCLLGAVSAFVAYEHLGFQAALEAATLRTGLNLSLDAIDHSLNVMAANPLAALMVPSLRRELEHARTIIAHSMRPNP